MNDVYTIEQLFSERLFNIPAYQRGYAWETEHRWAFLQDLELLLDGRDHYTGTVVLHAVGASRIEDEEGRSYSKFDVVDGQQRLTTMVLLLESIHREFGEIPGKAVFAAGVRKSYVAIKGVDGQALFRLRLNPDCQKYWEEVIVSDRPSPTPATIQSHKRLLDGQEEFRAYLKVQKAREGANWPDWLAGLYRKVTQQLKFTLYQVGTAAEVGVIFEVMNNRGKKLSELEKVKNYLLYLSSKLDVSGHDLADRINSAWAEIFESLMKAGLTRVDDENTVLRVHWLMACDHDRRTYLGSDGVKARFALQNYVGKHKALLEALRVYTKTLTDVALACADASHPSRPEAFASLGAEAPDVRAVSEKLLRMRVLAPFLPLLAATRLRFPREPGKYRAVLDFCERFAFRVYRLLGKRANAGQSLLYRVGHQVFNETMGYDWAMSELYGALRRYGRDEDVFKKLNNVGEMESWYGWSGLKYFLYEYEEKLAGAHGIRLTWAEVERRDLDKTIEHILPQTPTDPYWKKTFDAAGRKTYLNDLGNLVLTQHNGSLQNKAFSEKKGKSGQDAPCYATSVLFQEQQLCVFADWDPVTLLVRRKKIVDWATKRWAVPAAFAGLAAPATSIAPDDEDEDEDEDEPEVAEA